MNRAFHVGGMAWFATVFLAGIGISPLLGGLLGAAWLGIMLLRRKNAPLWAWSAALGLCLGCFCFLCYDEISVAPARRYENTIMTLHGVVVETVDYGAYATVVVKNDAENAAGLVGTRVRLSLNTGLAVELGDVVNYRTTLVATPKKRAALYADGLRFEGWLSSPFEKVGTQPRDMDVMLARYREKLHRSITRYLPGEEGDALSGMLFGRTEGMSALLRADYARAGISHLLSVSGLHMAILAALLEVLLRNLYLSRRQRGLLKMLAIIGFMGLTGFSPSVVRAGVMLLLCTAAELCGRDADGLNSLGVAVILLLLVNPYTAFSLSLQLSYLATMGVCAFSAPLCNWAAIRLWDSPGYLLEERHKWQHMLLQSICVTLAACLLTMPLIAWYFGEISLVSPIVNLLVAPLEPIVLGCGLSVGFLGFFPSAALLTRTLALASGAAVQQINECAAWWSKLPFAALPVRSAAVIFWMLAALAAWVLLWVGHASRAQKRYAASLAVLVLLSVLVVHTALWGDVVDVAVSSNGGTVALAYGKQGAVVGAPTSVYTARNLETFFNSRGVQTISLFVTKTEDDLYSNASELLKRKFAVKNAVGLDTTNGFSAELFGRVTVRAGGENAEFVTIELGGLRLVKAFVQQSQSADLLINARNDIICAPALRLRGSDRYFNCTVLSFHVLPYPPLSST